MNTRTRIRALLLAFTVLLSLTCPALGEEPVPADAMQEPAAQEEPQVQQAVSSAATEAPAPSSGYQTYGFDDLLEYTVYGESRHVPNAEDTMIQYTYPEAGGLLVVQCVPVPSSFQLTEDEVYGNLFPSFFSSIDGAAQNPLRYWEKRFTMNGYFAIRSKATYTAGSFSSHDDTFCVATANYIYSFHFADSLTYGPFPPEDILYIIASVNIL